MESMKVVSSPGWDPEHHEDLWNSPEVNIHIWKVVIGVTEKVRVFLVLYQEGSRRFWSGAHLDGGTHMNVGGGECPHNPGLGTPSVFQLHHHHHHHAVVLVVIPSTSPPSLAGSRRMRRHRAARTLNSEVP